MMRQEARFKTIENVQSRGDDFNRRFMKFSMLVFIVFYWLYSIRSNLNIGVRHLLPTFPFIYMLAAGGWKRWIEGQETPQPVSIVARFAKTIQAAVRAGGKYALLGLLLLWFASEVVLTAPFHLSYFNQLGGGTAQGYRYITDSNYDWGQDMLRLKAWAEQHPEADKIAVDYFGGGSARKSGQRRHPLVRGFH
jgi:NADH:ubiquinone oxidoreductase subunit 3 (subunit A)